MLIKIHKAYRDVVALCDKELLGKKFEQGNKQIEVNEKFYAGDEILENDALDILINEAKENACFNFVGIKACQTAMKAGIIEKKA